MFPKLHRDATDGDLDAVEDATEEEEATVLMPPAEGNTEAVTAEVDTQIGAKRRRLQGARRRRKRGFPGVSGEGFQGFPRVSGGFHGFPEPSCTGGRPARA